MDGFVVGSHGGLFEGLAERWVGVARARNVLARCPVLHAYDPLRDHLPGVGADDVNAEDPVGLFVAKDLDHSVCGVDRSGPAVRLEGEDALVVRDPVLLQVLLGLSNGGDFRVGVDDPWDGLVVDVPPEACDVLDGRDAFLLRFVRQHGPCDHVADGEDAPDVRLKVLVDDDAAELVHRDAHLLQPQPFGVRPAAGADQHDVELVLLGVPPLGRLHGQLDLAVVLKFGGGHLGLQLELHALLLQGPQEGLRDLGVGAGDDGVQKFYDVHFGAEAAPDGAHLEADDAPPDDRHFLGDLVDLEGPGAVDDFEAFVVNGDGGERRRLAPGGDEDVLGLDGLVPALAQRGADLVGAGDLPPPLHVVDAVLLEERLLDPLGKPLNGLSLARLHLVHVDGDVVDDDAVLLERVLGLVVQVRAVEQGLGRDAPDVQAGAPEGAPAFDAHGLQPELGGLDRGDVPPRASPNNADVVLFVRHGGRGQKGPPGVVVPRRVVQQRLGGLGRGGTEKHVCVCVWKCV
jgi:hypothetical protein